MNKLYFEGALGEGDRGMYGYCPAPVTVSAELMLKVKGYFKPRMEVICHYKFIPTPKGREIVLADITFPTSTKEASK